MKTIMSYFLETLYTAVTANGWTKLMAVWKLAIIPATTTALVEYASGWYVDNQKFIWFIIIAVIIDSIFGMIVHWKKKEFSFKELGEGFFKKMGIVIVGYVMFEMVHQIMSDNGIPSGIIKAVIQLMTLFYPLESLSKNMYILSGGSYPPLGFMKRMKAFNKDLDISHFKNLNKDESNEKPLDEDIDPDSAE